MELIEGTISSFINIQIARKIKKLYLTNNYKTSQLIDAVQTC